MKKGAPTVDSIANAARRPYHSPRLTEHGSVRDLTATTPSFGGPDGGTYPYDYPYLYTSASD